MSPIPQMAKIDHGTVEGSSKYAEETLRMFGAKMRELEDTRALAERSGDREWANRVGGVVAEGMESFSERYGNNWRGKISNDTVTTLKRWKKLEIRH